LGRFLDQSANHNQHTLNRNACSLQMKALKHEDCGSHAPPVKTRDGKGRGRGGGERVQPPKSICPMLKPDTRSPRRAGGPPFSPEQRWCTSHYKARGTCSRSCPYTAPGTITKVFGSDSLQILSPKYGWGNMVSLLGRVRYLKQLPYLQPGIVAALAGQSAGLFGVLPA
jgi:hypothetical protein